MENVNVDFAGFEMRLSGEYDPGELQNFQGKAEDAIESIDSYFHTAQVTIVRDSAKFVSDLNKYVKLTTEAPSFLNRDAYLTYLTQRCDLFTKLCKDFSEINITQMVEELGAYERFDIMGCQKLDDNAAKSADASDCDGYGGSD